ncbi:hypothetical protein FNF29_01808 [Cafeteria roenbergensis]|uniref:Uncharacterized protein n=1 Tax=Cafeteria roenbergensis TaxID=33653 RepID=A0A5A8CQT6_CAFRO|nr:hypothetical protein FNF29_01808 [Cafeteria roenbergensis]|eukprot:KAA0155433.1 hypothetical protein FNF29_01808 [Cafeteria roenbergensis]
MGGKSRRVPAASSEASPEERAANMAAYHAALKARGAISPRTAREAASPGREWHSSSAAQRSDDLIDVKPSLAENDDVVSTSDSDDGSEDAPAPAPAPRSARRASRDAVPSPVRRRASSSRRGRGSRSAQQRKQEEEEEEEEAGEEEAGRMEEDDEVEPAAAVLSEEEQEFESDTESEAGADAALADAGTDMADDEVPRVGRSSSSARRRHSARVGRGSGMSFGAAESPLRRPSHSAGQRRRSRGSGAAEHDADDGAIGAEGEDYEEEEGEEEVGPSLWQRIAFAMLVALLALLTAFAAVGLKPDMQVSPDSAPFVTAVATFLGLFVSEQEWAAALVRRLPCP